MWSSYRDRLRTFLSAAWQATRIARARVGDFCIKHPLRFLSTLIALLALLLFYHALPTPLFHVPTCTVIVDREGQLLSAVIADDGQYRFPQMRELPPKFEECITAFEDRYFRYHPGINPVALVNATISNARARRIVRGGSTITMQVARLMHSGAPRNLRSKAVEMLWALRLEAEFSKTEILLLYATHAPFGGNVVGLETAAWRYYGLTASELSWGQMAALAVLPNAPAVIYPGANSEAFLRKRNRVLNQLKERGIIDELTYDLATQEPLPSPSGKLPQLAPHLLSRAQKEGLQGQLVQTTVDKNLQEQAQRVVAQAKQQLQMGMVHNAAAIVARIEDGQVLAYVGNMPGSDGSHARYVDIIAARRSSASVIKPILYAGMLEDGLLLPHELVPDIPTKIADFSPQNANLSYAGAVKASEALARSLNVPIVRLLRKYGINLFLNLLHDVGFTTFTKSSEHYGLSLILGGGETTLWDLAGAYASLGRTVVEYAENADDEALTIHPLTYRLSHQPEGKRSPLGAGSIYLTLEALRQVGRPDEEIGWRQFSSSRAIAWKTGTSYGGRDAWAVSLNREYVVAVWVGNHDGLGQPDLSGVRAAAPIMFNLWSLLPNARWFDPPLDDLIARPLCAVSGLPPNPSCPNIDTTYTPAREADYPPCPYHQLIHLDSTETWRVNATCYPVSAMRPRVWFVLPPAMAWFYAQNHASYHPLPPWLAGCQAHETAAMQFIYPRGNNAKISVPRDMDGKPTAVRFEVAHQEPEQMLFWHLDGSYVGQTLHIHEMRLQPSEGRHTLEVVDEAGNRIAISFEVLYRAE